jgi:tRNA pseudouridine55 synthase
VHIEELDLLEYDKDTCVMRVVCGGGTYMRSLVHDMAIHMGTFAHMTALKRTRQGIFTLDKSLPLESISVTNVRKSTP